jgi:ATP-binding cassette, subfamily C, bacterial LapB
MLHQQLLDERFNKLFVLLRGMMSLPYFRLNIWDLVVATVLINLFSLALPLTLMQTYDRIIPNQALGSLFWLVIGCLIAMIFENTTRIIRSYISGWLAARFEHLISCSMINRLLAVRLEDFERYPVGTHLDRMNAIYTLRRFYAGQLFQVVLDVPFSILFLVAIWFLGSYLVLIPLGSLLLLVCISFPIRIGFQRSSTRQIKVNERRYDFILRLLNKIHLVKSMTLEEQMLRRHERFQHDTAEVSKRVAGWSMLPTHLGAFFSQSTLFGVIIVGALYVIDGTFTLGIVTACSMLAARAIQPIQSAISFWLRFSEANIAKKRLQEIVAMKTDSRIGLPPLTAELDGEVWFKNVSLKDPKGERWVLNNVSFSIMPREMVAVSAEDDRDAGRLLLLLTGRLLADSGSVLLDEYHLKDWNLSNLKGIVEFVARKGTLFKGSILDNITLFDPFRSFTAHSVARLLSIDEDVARLPLGYQTQVNHQSTFLSSGLIQRIALARALMIRPKIILLDRVDDLMDSASIEVFHRLLLRLKATCTVLMVTNSRLLLDLADRRLHLSQGKLNDDRII